tara:strand:- start:1348 stop:2058 length:711 start_codon:yes stop_codon:yes gene_type:complete
MENNFHRDFMLSMLPDFNQKFEDILESESTFHEFEHVHGQGYTFQMHDGHILSWAYGKHVDYSCMFYHYQMLTGNSKLVTVASPIGRVDVVKEAEKFLTDPKGIELFQKNVSLKNAPLLKNEDETLAMLKALYYFKGQERIKQILELTTPKEIPTENVAHPALKSGLAELRLQAYQKVHDLKQNTTLANSIKINEHSGWNISHLNLPKLSSRNRKPIAWEDTETLSNVLSSLNLFK